MNCILSVIMITYKHEKFIEQAVNGVLEQLTDFNFELIIANDNSPDKTHDVITNLLQSHPRGHLVRYLKNPVNLGANLNYIKAYNESLGKYIAVCEGDDIWKDNLKLQKQVDFLEKYPDYVLTYHDAQCIDEDGIKIPNVANCTPKKELSGLDLQKGQQPLPLTTCYRKILKNLPEELVGITNGDTFLISLLGAHGKGKWLDVKPAYYRHHIDGVWSLKTKEEKFISKLEIFKSLYTYYRTNGNNDLSLYFKNEIKHHSKMILLNELKKGNFKNVLKSSVRLFKVTYYD